MLSTQSMILTAQKWMQNIDSCYECLRQHRLSSDGDLNIQYVYNLSTRSF